MISVSLKENAGAKLNKPDTLSHYETQARAALYPELRAALENMSDIVGRLRNKTSVEIEQHSDARALLSRLPERDKEST